MVNYLNVHGPHIVRGVSLLKVNILSLEETKVTYEVSGIPICCYDQHSRARIGIKFFDYQVSEKPEYALYTQLFDQVAENNDFMHQIFSTLSKLEKIREANDFKTPFNLMSRMCSYKVTQDYSSMKGQMARRLKFCEEEFVVGLHWLLRYKLLKAPYFTMEMEKGKQLVKIFEQFLPGCDVTGECDYASADYLSNMFGCLFAGCNRWPSHADYASFNQSCTTPEMLEKQLHIKIPRSKFEIEMKAEGELEGT